MKTYSAVPISQTRYSLGESPFYDPRYKRLSWVDITAGRVYSLYDDGRTEVFDAGQHIGAAVPLERSDGFLIAGTDGLYVKEGGGMALLYDLSDVFEPFLRSNDAKADPSGRLWFGSSCDDDGHGPQGDLYRFDGRPVVMQSRTSISNGMAWNAAQDRFFFSDSLYYAVFAYDYDRMSGSISGRRTLFEVKDGCPDGMCIDKDDRLWTAVWGGSRVECHSSVTGEKLAEIAVSAKNVTSCAFGGNDMRTLFITSSGEGLNGRYDGCVFSCRVDAEGLPPDTVII
ncbi:MAG: SMP-30/gluconolactonase/LRE family protein [Oscillospiraceae bacterium]|nr:SMP-30/gluconolactonase/LRE family protein [Oscillospiraceae bacterium]